jgi:uncharacterized membrane protein YphA (DoxX/SURF4 family)
MIRILIGITFIVSAILKIMSIDAFEIYVFSLKWFDFGLTSIIARVLIAIEFVIGL